MRARIAIDAMGGDEAPEQIVEGALMAAGGLGVDLILLGPREIIARELEGTTETPGLRIVDAPDLIDMHESPTEAVKAKPRSSIVMGLELVKAGEADAFVTAGNTGATMAAALLTLGRIHGIGRPALAAVFPSVPGPLVMLLDVGANAECRPIHLVQFAHLASAYMERVHGIERPKVSLLSIGEESSKGNELVLETHPILAQSGLHFIGNVEGRDVLRGIADVIVMDGFTGNVVLKTCEGLAELLFNEIRKAVELTPWNRAAGLVLMSELRKTKRRLDYTEYGGAPLLGIDGITYICHGRSNARAMFNAIRAARDAVQSGVLDVMREVARKVPARAPRSANGDDANGADD